MMAINYSSMRDNFKSYCDKVTDDCETVIITRKGDKNVVMMSLEQYNNIMENIFVFGSKPYHDKLIESVKQIERGESITRSSEELERLADE